MNPPLGIMIFRSRFGFRAGWLYIHPENGCLYRFRAGEHFDAEVRGTNKQWQPLDRSLRDEYYDRFCAAVPFELTWTKNLIPHGIGYEEKASGQICMPWVIPDSDRYKLFRTFHWRRFLETLPGCVRRNACKIPAGRFAALDLLLRVPSAVDLVEHNPVLAAALSCHWEFPAVGRLDWDEVRRQVKRRRRDIAGWLGFTATDATVNKLERLVPATRHIASDILRGLALLNDSEYGPALAEVREMDGLAIDFLSNPKNRRWLDGHTLAHVAKSGLSYHTVSHWDRIASLMEVGAIDVDTAQFFSIPVMEEAIPTELPALLKPHALPLAPISTMAGVKLLNSLDQLIDEGQVMHHCVGSLNYLAQAATGSVAIYRIASPVRATLALFKTLRGEWKLHDIKGPHNSPISAMHIRQITESFPTNVDADEWMQDKIWAA